MTAWVSTYRGIPYADDGFSREGLGCRGLVWLHYRETLGIEIEAHAGVVSTVERDAAEAAFRGAFAEGPWIRVERGDEREHDVAWLYEMRGGELSASHVGLVIRPGLMLHAHRTAGLVVPDAYDRGLWAKLLIGFHRHQKMDRPHAA